MEMCKKCHGTKKLVIGLLLLLNAYVWPKWSGFDGWMAWFGVLFVLMGVLMLFVPNNCKGCNAPAKGKKK